MFSKFLTLPTRFFEERTVGPLLSRLTYNVEMVAESVTSVVTIAIRDVLTVVAALTVMYIQSPKLLLFISIVFPILALVVKYLSRAFRRYSSRIQDSVGEVTQVTEEIVRGNRVVKIFGGQKYETERLEEVDGRNRRQNLKLIRVRSLGVAVTQVIFRIRCRRRCLHGGAGVDQRRSHVWRIHIVFQCHDVDAATGSQNYQRQRDDSTWRCGRRQPVPDHG